MNCIKQHRANKKITSWYKSLPRGCRKLIADYLGVCDATVSNIFLGKCSISLKNAVLISSMSNGLFKIEDIYPELSEPIRKAAVQAIESQEIIKRKIEELNLKWKNI